MEERIFFDTPDGLKLCGILTTPKSTTQECIILCHGLTVDKNEGGTHTELARRLIEHGYATFREVMEKVKENQKI